MTGVTEIIFIVNLHCFTDIMVPSNSAAHALRYLGLVGSYFLRLLFLPLGLVGSYSLRLLFLPLGFLIAIV